MAQRLVSDVRAHVGKCKSMAVSCQIVGDCPFVVKLVLHAGGKPVQAIDLTHEQIVPWTTKKQDIYSCFVHRYELRQCQESLGGTIEWIPASKQL